jgi:hypothetical protein
MKNLPVLVAAMVMAGSAAAAAPPRPDVVGQIVEQTSGAVKVRHGGTWTAAKPYQPLYEGDEVTVTGAKSRARIEIAESDGLVTVTAGSSPYRVGVRHAAVDPAAFRRFVERWGFVLQPPAPRRAEATTPRSLEPLPALFPIDAEQRVRSLRRQSLPIVWSGEAAQVQLKSSAGAVLAKAAPSDQGFALLDTPALSPGKYRLQIGEQAAELTIDVAASDAVSEPAGSSPEERALKAAEMFDGSVHDRLQALADLQALAPHSFLAHAVMRAVRSGNYAPKAVNR